MVTARRCHRSLELKHVLNDARTVDVDPDIRDQQDHMLYRWVDSILPSKTRSTDIAIYVTTSDNISNLDWFDSKYLLSASSGNDRVIHKTSTESARRHTLKHTN